MIKRLSIKRILRTTLFIFVLFLLYLFPEKEEYHLNLKSVNAVSNYHEIYLLDKNNYVSKTTISVSSIEKEKMAKDLLSSLTIDSKNSVKIPNSFYAVIPKGTKVNKLKINNDLITVSFNDNIKNTKDKIKMIECITYTLTSISNIKKVELLINEKEDEYFNKIYTRKIGVNKEYEITSLNDIKSVTLYYVSKENDVSYYIPVTKLFNSKDDKIKIIIDELSTRSSYESNLMSYLNYQTKLISYNLEDNELYLYFNDAILSSKEDNKILEEVVYSISYSIEDTMNVSNIHFFVDNIEM